VRAVVQRVREAAVSLAGDEAARIGPGLLVLLGVAADDTEEVADRLATKVAGLRILENEAGRMDRSVLDDGGAALVVSQFTLIADTRKGNRPSFTGAAEPELAERLYLLFCEKLRTRGVPVETGVFDEHMEVALVNDGPVTIVLDL
jgi:D-tyrosyl-tRNA(Tyr) deacylase